MSDTRDLVRAIESLEKTIDRQANAFGWIFIFLALFINADRISAAQWGALKAGWLVWFLLAGTVGLAIWLYERRRHR